MNKPTYEELQSRILNAIDPTCGTMPERTAIAWRAYITGLFEWGLLSGPDFLALSNLIPIVKNDPTGSIMIDDYGY